MSEGNKPISIALSIVAILGPVSYMLYAFYEIGRLGYFRAPIEFMQLSSFGVMPVIEAVHPGIIFTAIIWTFFGGMRYRTGAGQLASVFAVIGYCFLAISGLSIDERYTFGFGIAGVCAILIALLIPTSVPELGNEEDPIPPLPVPAANKYSDSIRKWILILAAVAVFIGGNIAAGSKKAKQQDEYWIVKNEVVLGFYGDMVLLGELNGKQVGPNFKIAETKSLDVQMRRVKTGPLVPFSAP
ncbi:hypothetical protein KID96_23410 [Pseudomonas syringae]|uniref:hypothetical protein n=1 Tax=Pseudomonas syringae TaxID=317 RepID=UPI001BD100DA|nr:hypothetical protein [Pseudomonas syringae]MBS7440277.1 hypothetical protein [Pseudomonas syringae]